MQTRLDPETEATLKALVRHLNWSPSRVVREGVRILAACYGTGSSPKVIGLGRFQSGVADLGSNKKHLKGFGC